MPETIYQRLFGLKRVINASGTMTALRSLKWRPHVSPPARRRE
jgi:seryl-tRNA(Sec) selenium transferase